MSYVFRILLDHGADANSVLNLEYRTAALLENGATESKGKSNRSISTIQYVMQYTSDKDMLCPLIEKLLSKVDDFEKAVEFILEYDPSLSFRLLKTILNVAQQQKGKDIANLINKKYGDDSLTALHMAVGSNYSDDISEEMAYLLEHGGDILIPGIQIFIIIIILSSIYHQYFNFELTINILISGGSEQPNNYLLPIHIVASLQYSSDNKSSISSFGCGEYSKSRLKQYLNSLKDYGISKLLENKAITYREDFIRYHLIPGIYAADHGFVHAIMYEYYGLNSVQQNDIIHWKQDQNEHSFDFQMFWETALYWATQQRQQAIMSDIVRAEFNVHNDR